MRDWSGTRALAAGAMMVCVACPSPTASDAGGLDAAVLDGGRVDAGWSVAFEDDARAVLSINARAPDDVWLCGARGDAPSPLLMHGTPEGWTSFFLPASVDLWWVHRVDDLVVVVGSGGAIFVIDEATQTARPVVHDQEATLFGIWGTSLDRLWAVGTDTEGGNTGVVLSVNATASANVTALRTAPFDVPVPGLMKVWGRSDDDVWIVGRSGTVFHHDGLAWAPEHLDDQPRLTTVHGNDGELVVVGGDTQGVIRTRSGAAPWQDHSPGGFFPMSGVFVNEAGQVLVGGNGGTAHFRNADGGWAEVSGLPMVRDWHAAAIDGSGGLWLAGGLLGSVDSLAAGAVAVRGPTALRPGSTLPSVALTLVAPATDAGPADGGADDAGLDAGSVDAGSVDAGPPDAAVLDAGPAADSGLLDGGFGFFGPPAPPLTDQPSDFAVALGHVAGDFSFAPAVPGSTAEIVQGPQGGIHLEIGAQASLTGPPGALVADVFGRVLIDGSDVAEGTYSNVTLLEVAPGVYQTNQLLLIFETNLAAPYVGWPATVELLIADGSAVGWTTLDVTLADVF